MTRERVVLWALQGLLVGLPLLRGGRTPVAVVLGCATVVALLVVTIRARPRSAPGGGALVALDRANGQVIGSSRYHGYDSEQSVIEIGWTFLARAYWGGRYNGEMKRLMLEHAFRWVTRVVFIIGPDNRRSQRAVEKIGGVHAGTTTDARGQARLVYELTPALYAQHR